MRNRLVPPGLIFSAFASFCVLVALLGWWGGHDNPASLSDQINRACDTKPGYVVADWSSGDEYKTLPEGTVEVTCQQARSPFRTFKVSVER